MPEKAPYGSDWRGDELDLIVADYFAMLGSELAKQPYVKAHHCKVVMQQLGRSHRSVEFKHQNISAVLDKLGLPWIPGYRPKANYQNAIFDAIDRYLSGHQQILEVVATPPLETVEPQSSFVAAPALAKTIEKTPERLARLIAKFDPVERDFRNRALGRNGESFVVELERHRMKERGRHDLAERVRWTSQQDGDGAGYDIESFDLTRDASPLLIEVKTTNGSARTPFFLTKNEIYVAEQKAVDWRIYRVHEFSTSPKLFILTPPLQAMVNLTPESWRASFS